MAIKNLYSTAAGNGPVTQKKKVVNQSNKTYSAENRDYSGVLPTQRSATVNGITYKPDSDLNGVTVDHTGTTFHGSAVPQGVVVGDLTLKEDIGGGSGSGSGGSSAYNPTSDLMAAYNARQAALQKNFDISREQLQKAYDDSVNALRTQGEDAMRQAYINMMMSKRGLGQSLEAAGLRGGATESALAGIYNNYANNRNSIARAIEEGLTNAGNVYGNNLANLGMQYNTNSADAMEDYQKQLINARQSLANTLAKTASNSRGTSTDVIAANLKNFVKSPVSARRYLSSLGITGSAADEYLWNAGIDPANTYEDAQSTGLNQDYVSILKNFRNDPESAKAYADSVGGLSDDYYWAAGINPNSTIIDPSLATTLVSDLNNVVAEANRHTRNENLIEQSLANRMRELAAQYGLTEEQARYILAQAGY